MAWMSDEEYELRCDSREKAITARSAKHTRTHCGKGGRVTFPSDYLTKKERDAMNGEVKSYRMNDPMTWEEFREMPDDLKKVYILAIRKKYQTPDKDIAQAMGISKFTFCKQIGELGLSLGKSAGVRSRNWAKSENSVAFYTWWHGGDPAKVDDEPEPVAAIEESDNDELIAVCDNPEIEKHIEDDIKTAVEATEGMDIQHSVVDYATPTYGEMIFEGEIDSVLRSIHRLLEGQNVHLQIKWDVLDKEEIDISGELNKEELLKKLRGYEKATSYAILNEERRKATGSKG